MERWRGLRGCIHNPAFLNDLHTLGIPIETVDAIIEQDIEPVLCGASDELLDIVYPPLVEDWRLLLTNPRPGSGLPALRVAFRMEQERVGLAKVELLRCSLA